MVEEQIKQNAEAYASKLVERDYHEDIWLDLYDAHIAGAHSRDEEIEELQNEIESLRKGFYERGDKLKELMLTNNQLRNPWVKIEEHKPSLETEDERKKKCIVRFGEYGHFAHIILNAQDFLMMSGEAIEGSYWMYLPE